MASESPYAASCCDSDGRRASSDAVVRGVYESSSSSFRLTIEWTWACVTVLALLRDDSVIDDEALGAVRGGEDTTLVAVVEFDG